MRRIIVAFKRSESDPLGNKLEKTIKNFLGIKTSSIRTRRVYLIDANLSNREFSLLEEKLFVDPVSEYLVKDTDEEFDWLIEVGYKPGVTDNVGKTSKNVAIPGVIGRKLKEGENVYTSTQYLISRKRLKREDVEIIGRKLLANPIIESIKIVSSKELKGREIPISPPVMKGIEKINIKSYDLGGSEEELIKISNEGVLSLSLEEMKMIRDYFKRESVIAERKKIRMDKTFWNNPTDAEMEAIAQTWSEHCKHKIFNAIIHYTDEEKGESETIYSLFNTYIKNPSNAIASRFGWVASSFHDNAGVVRFNDRILVADKIETHNAPSALDPYGGSITGIVGVNRDPMGTGKGAKLMFNVFGYCFGSPFYNKELSEGILHPRRIRDGVHKGVIDGGNQSGIPLVNGWEFFDERFAFRPLVYCGTIGIMPTKINGKPSEIKKADSNDVIIMVGGRIGKDGIHGATFSSAELHKQSPVQAVQIGDPIMQKKMSDFLLEARDSDLYKCITDNGAGGLSSSIGEMALDSNGCNFDLKKAPLKYHGLDPWEILLSEAQERMTVAVAPGKVKRFLDLAKRRDVEATVLGRFENSGKFHITYGNKTVVYLNMNFLHGGTPRMELNAKWRAPSNEEPKFGQPKNMNKVLEDMLSRLNICSKEDKLRQYDHEVKGLSVVKLLVGKDCDTPSDATISFLEYGSKEGLGISAAANPHYSDIDTYHMVASVIDEAVRKIIAIGGKLPSKKTVFYGIDNFCWNLSSLESEDGQFKLAQLVRANKALANYCDAFGVPCISGKDSMKNVWRTSETVDDKTVEKVISIPPTLLFSARSKIADVGKAVTMDMKNKEDLVYIVGKTYDELGASEYFSYIGEKLKGERYIGNKVPKVDAIEANRTYSELSKVTEKELASSIHTPTIGGLGVALAQSAFAGGYGIEVDLKKVPYFGEKRDDYVLFSQSNSRFIVTIPPRNRREFEKIMKNTVFARIGAVTGTNRVRIRGLSGDYIIDSDINKLKFSWKKTLEGV